MTIQPISLTTAFFRLLVVTALITYARANAATRVEATVTVTNTAATGDLLQFNLQGRWWTNNTLASTNWIITTNSAPPTATNLFAHAVANPFSNVVQVSYASPTSLVFYANFDTPLSGSVTGSWAVISFRTNYIQTSGPVTMPYPTNITEAFRTNQMTALMSNLQNSSLIVPNATGAFSNLVDRTTAQTISGKTIIESTNSGYIVALTNGYWTNATLGSPKLTNAINYGNAFSSRGTNTQSEQFGQNSTAKGAGALAIGYSADADGLASVAIGFSAESTETNSLAMGLLASASGYQSMSIGGNSQASERFSIAIGSSAQSTFSNAIAIGYAVATTKDNEIRLGGSQDVTIGGLLTAEKGATNVSLLGISTNTALIKGGTYTNAILQNPFATNLILSGGQHSLKAGASWAVQQASLTTIANGANVFEVGSNAFVRITGSPTAAWQLAGIIGDLRDGRMLTLENLTGYGMTILNESGLASTAGTRISCGVSFELDSGSIMVLAYDATAARWKVISSRNTVGSANGLVFVTVGTNYNGTNWAPLTTNIAAGVFPVGAFAQLASAGSNYLVLSGATANYTNLFSTAPAERLTTNAIGALATGTLTPVYSGYYLVNASFVIWAEVDNNGDEIEIEIFLNGVAQDHTESHVTLATGVKSSLATSSLLYIPAGTAVTVGVRNESDASSSLPVIQSRLNIDSP